MTDNEIIKALECCGSETNSCKGCPLSTTHKTCIPTFSRNALNLINRQKAEIESLKAHNESLKARCTDINSAVRAFAGMLKTKALQKFDWNEYVEVEDIDKLVKELTERKEDEGK